VVIASGGVAVYRVRVNQLVSIRLVSIGPMLTELWVLLGKGKT